MKKIDCLIFVLLMLAFCLPSQAQKSWNRTELVPSIGADLTYYFQTDDFFKYHEADFTLRATLPVWKNFQAGVLASYLTSFGNTFANDQFYMAGGFLEYRFVTAGPFDVFAHAGLSTGNICDCEFTRPPYEIHNSLYLSVGPRATYQLGDHWFGNLAMLFQPILSKSVFPGWTNRPFMGMEYRF